MSDDNSRIIKALNSLFERRGFIWGPSPEIYQGVSGFYDFGPTGKSVKNAIVDTLRSILREEDLTR